MRPPIKIQRTYVIVLASIVLGVIASLMIFQEYLGSGVSAFTSSREDLQLTAHFRDGRLIVTIANLGSNEVEVQIIFLEGRNYVDFDTLPDAVVKPGEVKEIKTDIMQPEKGTYNVRVKLSNGKTVSCKVIAGD